MTPGDAPLLPHLSAKTVHLGVPADPQAEVADLLRGELPLLALAVSPSQRVEEEEEKHLLLQRTSGPPVQGVQPAGASSWPGLQTPQEGLGSSAGGDPVPRQGGHQTSQHPQPPHRQRVHGEREKCLLVWTFIITKQTAYYLLLYEIHANK